MTEAGLVASDVPSEVAYTDDEQKQKAEGRLRQEALADTPPQVAAATTAGLPELILVDTQTQPAARALDQDTLEKTAKELHEAIFRKQLGIRDDPDEEKIRRLLDPLGAADRAALEKTYHDFFDKNGSADTLRRDLQKKLSDVDWREAESMLNRVDGRTNDAGAIMLAVTRMKSDGEIGNADILAVFRTLNSQQIAQLDRDFRKQYGISYQDMLKNAKNLKESTRQAISILERGSDRRTADDCTRLAQIALDNRDKELFVVALSGDSAAAKDARARLKQSDKFKEQLAGVFPSIEALERGEFWKPGSTSITFDRAVDRACLDYFRDGRISLATIADANSGSWIFGNKGNIELAARNATEEERAEFTRGRALAKEKKTQLTEDERRALEYYNGVHKAFIDAGSERETTIWEDQLLHGRPTIISEMAGLHSDGHGPFKWGAGHNRDELFKFVENLSKEDWLLLTGADGRTFLSDIEASLRIYASSEEREAIVKLIVDKASKSTYEESQAVKRNFGQIIDDNKGNVFLWMGTDYDGKDITKAIAQMPQSEIDRYMTDPCYRKQIEDFVTSQLEDAEQILARRLLKQIESTGIPPEPDAIDKVLLDKISGANPIEYFPHLEEVFKDKALFDRLSQPDEQLTPDERRIKDIIKEMVFAGAYVATGPNGEPTGGEGLLSELYEKGRFSLKSKLLLGYKRSSLIEEAIKAPVEERTLFMQIFKPEEAAIITHVLDNGGTLELEDRLRMFIITGDGDYQAFEPELLALSHSAKQKLKDDYFDKYGGVLHEDFLKKVRSQADKTKFENLFTPADNDGRQDFLDNYHRMLESRSGLSPDGSALTVERATQIHANLLETYQSQFQKLPPEQQRAMNDFFGEAMKQYQDSKEKLAEVLIDATITAAALTAAPFTAGMSTAALVAMVGTAAVAGAAYRVAALKMVQGSDFNASADNIIKQLIIGGTNAALNFIGPELFTGAGKLAAMGEQQLIAYFSDPSLIARARQLGEMAVKEGVVGAASNVVSDLVTLPAYGEPVDIESLAWGAIIGFGVGVGVPIGIQTVKSVYSGGRRLVSGAGRIISDEGRIGDAGSALSAPGLTSGDGLFYKLGDPLPASSERISEATLNNGATVKYGYDNSGQFTAVELWKDGEQHMVLKSERTVVNGQERIDWFDYSNGEMRPITVSDGKGGRRLVTRVDVTDDGALLFYHADGSGESWALDGTRIRFDKSNTPQAVPEQLPADHAAGDWVGNKYKIKNGEGQITYRNDDAHWVSPNGDVGIVIDGVGGNGGGDVAAEIIRERMSLLYANFHPRSKEEALQWLNNALNEADREIRALQRRAAAYGTFDGRGNTLVIGKRADGSDIVISDGMAATIAATVRYKDELLVAWAGDSRVYLFKNGKLNQLTVDDSPPDPARGNMITNGLGHPAGFTLHSSSFSIKDGDRFLLQTDGLESLPKEQIEAILAASATPGEAQQGLINAVREQNKASQDNVTAAVFDFGAVRPRPAVPPNSGSPLDTLPPIRDRVSQSGQTTAPASSHRRASVKVGGRMLDPQKVYTIGRHSTDIIVPGAQVSGAGPERAGHAALCADESGNVFIQDLWSTNGTYVNGKKIEPGLWVRIKPTDKVTFAYGGPQLDLSFDPLGRVPSGVPAPQE